MRKKNKKKKIEMGDGKRKEKSCMHADLREMWLKHDSWQSLHSLQTFIENDVYSSGVVWIFPFSSFYSLLFCNFSLSTYSQKLEHAKAISGIRFSNLQIASKVSLANLFSWQGATIANTRYMYAWYT